MKSQALHPAWCYMFGETAGEMWNFDSWSGLRFHAVFWTRNRGFSLIHWYSVGFGKSDWPCWELRTLFKNFVASLYLHKHISETDICIWVVRSVSHHLSISRHFSSRQISTNAQSLVPTSVTRMRCVQIPRAHTCVGVWGVLKETAQCAKVTWFLKLFDSSFQAW